jgi:hypothetical protein
MIATSLKQHRPLASCSRDTVAAGSGPPHIAPNSLPVASYVQKIFWLKIATGVCGPEFAFVAFKTKPSQENNMPNRGELPNPRRAKDAAAPGPSDAWPIICFCAAGALMSIYMAVSYVGIDAVPRLMSQFPGG